MTTTTNVIMFHHTHPDFLQWVNSRYSNYESLDFDNRVSIIGEYQLETKAVFDDIVTTGNIINQLVNRTDYEYLKDIISTSVLTTITPDELTFINKVCVGMLAANDGVFKRDFQFNFPANINTAINTILDQITARTSANTVQALQLLMQMGISEDDANFVLVNPVIYDYLVNPAVCKSTIDYAVLIDVLRMNIEAQRMGLTIYRYIEVRSDRNDNLKLQNPNIYYDMADRVNSVDNLSLGASA